MKAQLACSEDWTGKGQSRTLKEYRGGMDAKITHLLYFYTKIPYLGAWALGSLPYNDESKCFSLIRIMEPTTKLENLLGRVSLTTSSTFL